MSNETIVERAKAPSKILVLGATGPTGQLIVNHALSQGHEVTALVRSPEKAGTLAGAKLIFGDARNEPMLREALKGNHAVVSALGTPASPFREVTSLSTATGALISAMKAERSGATRPPVPLASVALICNISW